MLLHANNLQADEDIKFEICDNFCHALWQEDKTTNGTKITILSQGTYREIIKFITETFACLSD
jgi:hypothetical protein